MSSVTTESSLRVPHIDWDNIKAIGVDIDLLRPRVRKEAIETLAAVKATQKVDVWACSDEKDSQSLINRLQKKNMGQAIIRSTFNSGFTQVNSGGVRSEDADYFHEFVTATGFDPDRVCYVAEGPTKYKAATKYGLGFIALESGHPDTPNLLPHLNNKNLKIIHRFTEILDILSIKSR